MGTSDVVIEPVRAQLLQHLIFYGLPNAGLSLLEVKCPVYIACRYESSYSACCTRTQWLSSELEFIVPLMLKIRPGTQCHLWRIFKKGYLPQKGRGEKIYEIFYSSRYTVKSAEFFLKLEEQQACRKVLLYFAEVKTLQTLSSFVAKNNYRIMSDFMNRAANSKYHMAHWRS